MLKTNEDRLVSLAVQGKVVRPSHRGGFSVGADGQAFALPGTGGITYNVKVGDSAFGWAGDHVEPGVSCVVDDEKRQAGPNTGFNVLACAGNTAKLVSGDAKGKTGTVIGHHGGAEHVIVDFDDETMDEMTLDDKILIRTIGQGLALLDYPEVKCFNLDPSLLHRMGIEENGDGTLTVPVTLVVPAQLMGSGLGSTYAGRGDYDIMTHDEEYIKELGIDRIRFGDFVAIQDHDNAYGRTFRRGSVTIGIVMHSNCLLSGHGPGVTTLLTASTPLLKPKGDEGANIAEILSIGRHR